MVACDNEEVITGFISNDLFNVITSVSEQGWNEHFGSNLHSTRPNLGDLA